MTHLPNRPFPPLRDGRSSTRGDAANPWAAPPPRGLWRRLAHWWLDAAERRRSRRLLAQLDHRQLHDIGVSRGDALIEARKPFWRL